MTTFPLPSWAAMRPIGPGPVLRGVGRLATLAAGSLAVAGLFAAATAALSRLKQGGPVDWVTLPLLPQSLSELAITGVFVAVLALEWLTLGWERSALRRILAGDDASTRTDLFYVVAQATGLTTVLVTFATLGLGLWLNGLAQAGLGLRLAIDLPLWLACPILFLWQSFATYWGHRMVHTRLFWPVHAVHHAATDFNVIASARHHPVDGFVGYLVLSFIPALLGFPSPAVLGVVWVVIVLDLYQHSRLPTLPWVERHLCFGPRGHALHHSADPRWFDKNFGGDLVLWDRLFGTYAMQLDEPVPLGTADPQGIYQSGHPLRDILLVQEFWVTSAATIIRTGLTRLATAAKLGRSAPSHNGGRPSRPA